MKHESILMPFRIKICGVTTADDARLSIDAGADAIGLNFYPKSRRFLSDDTAGQICAAAPEAMKVGVFVNAPPAQLLECVQRFNLNLAQIHGDESPELLAELGAVPIVRAFRSDGDIQSILDYMDKCARLGVSIAGVLIDAHVPNEYGGSGQVGDWSAARRLRDELGELPLILAGGLTPLNVAEAIASVQPSGVDTASGVEGSGVRKKAVKCREFVSAARRAFDRLSQ